MNYGYYRGDRYIKKVSFSRAVLWHTRQLSLRADVIAEIKRRGVKKLVFSDSGKGERWVFKVEKVLDKMEYKLVGQEEQYYFPIDLAKKEKFKTKTWYEAAEERAEATVILNPEPIKTKTDPEPVAQLSLV